MSNRAAQACDGCRVRKVKCNSTQPCSQCSHLGLGCIYSPSTKRKPSVRNRLVTQLRNKSSIAASSHGIHIAASPSDYPERPPGPAVTSIAGIVNPDQDGMPSAGSCYSYCWCRCRCWWCCWCCWQWWVWIGHWYWYWYMYWSWCWYWCWCWRQYRHASSSRMGRSHFYHGLLHRHAGQV